MITLDDIEKMKEVRRMRYFNELFLKQEEFVLDQNYHIRMRRLHNRRLHSSGIVWGLEVKEIPDNTTSVKIFPGMALNKVTGGNGEEVSQEIIFFDEEKIIDLGENTAAKNEEQGVYIYICRNENKDHIEEQKGGSEEIHWLETAEIKVKQDEPDNKNDIILAKVKLIGNTVSIDTTDRIYAGAYGKLALSVDGEESALSIEGKKFDTENGIQINSPITNFAGALEVRDGITGDLHISGESGNNNLVVDGNCTIGGDLEVQGNTTTINTATLEVEDNIITVNKGAASGMSGGIEVDRGPERERPKIFWDEDAEEKRWKISGDDGVLVNLGYGTDWETLTNTSMADSLHRHSKLVGADGSNDPALSVDNGGNVGIGTEPSATERLAVDGTVKATAINASEISGDTLNLAENAEIKGTVGIGTIPSKSERLAVDGKIRANEITSENLQVKDTVSSTTIKASEISGDTLNLAKNAEITGNVGIGTVPSATDRLSVKGTIRSDEIASDKLAVGAIKADEFIGGKFSGDGSNLTGIAQTQWFNDPAGIYYKNNVGIGTGPTATDRLSVDGTVKATAINVSKISGDSLNLAGNARIKGGVDIGGDLNVTGTVNGNFADGSVVTSNLADNAVTSNKLQSDVSIDANRAVTTDHIKDNAVTEAKLEQVIREKLAAVVTSELVQEIIDARGIKANLGNRLDESLTKGGQLRSNVVGKDQLNDEVRNQAIPRIYRVPLLRQTLFSRPVPSATVTVGTNPYGIAFDGTHIWVANISGNNVSKIAIINNTVVATVAVGTNPYWVAFDGTHIWVTNYGNNTVSKIDISNNTVVATVAVTHPYGVAFDGTHIWVANYTGNTVCKIAISNNTVVATVAVGTYPVGVAFDGTHIWVSNYTGNTVSKIDISNNTVVATVAVGTRPAYLAFDGMHIWVSNYNGNTVSKIDISNNTVVATVAVGTVPAGVAFDGTHIWVSNYTGNNVSKINISNNAVVATVAVGKNPYGIVFDGTHIWVANQSSNNVTKISGAI